MRADDADSPPHAERLTAATITAEEYARALGIPVSNISRFALADLNTPAVQHLVARKLAAAQLGGPADACDS